MFSCIWLSSISKICYMWWKFVKKITSNPVSLHRIWCRISPSSPSHAKIWSAYNLFENYLEIFEFWNRLFSSQLVFLIKSIKSHFWWFLDVFRHQNSQFLSHLLFWFEIWSVPCNLCNLCTRNWQHRFPIFSFFCISCLFEGQIFALIWSRLKFDNL